MVYDAAMEKGWKEKTLGMLEIKRTYDRPTRDDGRRILVERLWPRGMKKDALAADAWMKEVAPSGELRQWFSHKVERWDEFRRKYRKELDAKPDAWRPILEAEKGGTVSLLYSARDVAHNSAVVLRDYLLERQAAGRTRHGKRGREEVSAKTSDAKERRTKARTAGSARRRAG
jgi:uncharacterized protein YeaO (DUF488 family)